jgi:hypothetical protein
LRSKKQTQRTTTKERKHQKAAKNSENFADLKQRKEKEN